MTKQSLRKSTDGSTLVTSDNYYIKVTNPIARQYCGSKCILINKGAGCSYEGILREKYLDGKSFVTHFAPFPTFNPNEDKENTSHKEAWKGRQHHLNRVGEALGYGPGPYTEKGLSGLVAVDMLFPRPGKFYVVESGDRDGITQTLVREKPPLSLEEEELPTSKKDENEKQVKTVKALMDFHVAAIDSSKPTLWKRFRRKVFGN